MKTPGCLGKFWAFHLQMFAEKDVLFDVLIFYFKTWLIDEI